MTAIKPFSSLLPTKPPATKWIRILRITITAATVFFVGWNDIRSKTNQQQLFEPSTNTKPPPFIQSAPLSKNKTHNILPISNYERAVANNDNNRPPPSMAFNDKRMIVTISLGEQAAKSPLVDRAHRSARGPGNYEGFFAVLTDAPPDRYNNLKEKDDRFFVFQAKEEDIKKDIHPKLAVQYFKTLILKYVAEVPILDSVNYFVYIDFDIIIGKSIDGYEHLIMEQRIANQKAYHDAHPRSTIEMSSIYFFEEIDGHSKAEPYHTGQFSFDRNSERCFRLWGQEIIECYLPHKYHLSDQVAVARLGRAIDAGNVTGCSLYTIPRDRLILFPTAKSMEGRAVFPFVHVTNTFRAGQIPEDLQVAYFADILNLTAEERASPSSFFVSRVDAKTEDLRKKSST